MWANIKYWGLYVIGLAMLFLAWPLGLLIIVVNWWTGSSLAKEIRSIASLLAWSFQEWRTAAEKRRTLALMEALKVALAAQAASGSKPPRESSASRSHAAS